MGAHHRSFCTIPTYDAEHEPIQMYHKTQSLPLQDRHSPYKMRGTLPQSQSHAAAAVAQPTLMSNLSSLTFLTVPWSDTAPCSLMPTFVTVSTAAALATTAEQRLLLMMCWLAPLLCLDPACMPERCICMMIDCLVRMKVDGGKADSADRNVVGAASNAKPRAILPAPDSANKQNRVKGDVSGLYLE